MAINLSRNTKVYFTTNTTLNSGYTNANTWEIKVLDGFSFNQGADQQTITLNEAGMFPSRGQRSFNTVLKPVEWSISTYLRPRQYTQGSVYVTADEKLLWNALAGSHPVMGGTAAIAASTASVSGNTVTVTMAAHSLTTGSSSPDLGKAINLYGTITGSAGILGSWKIAAIPSSTTVSYIADVTPTAGTGWTNVKAAFSSWYEPGTANAITTFAGSDKHQLQNFALVFLTDNTAYKVDGCAVNQADVQFDIGGIAMAAFSGFGTALTEMSGAGVTNVTASAVAANTTAKFITNKLSTLTIASQIGGGGTSYSIPITGGNITINNNLEYVTPSILGIVNSPVGYFTGTRAISGALTAYLRSGAANESGKLLQDILTTSASSPETKYKVQVEVGGISNNIRVEFLANGCMVQVPTVDVQDVISTNIGFTAQGFTAGTQNYDITANNDLSISYYSDSTSV